MRRSRVGVVAVSLALGTGFLAHTQSRWRTRDAFFASEAGRLERHFDSVDVELRMRPVDELATEPRVRRDTLIVWLRDYLNAGSFPRNDRIPDRAAPYFRDARGILCAMAYLIDRSGRRDIVDRIAAERNNAYIAELVGDTAIVAWLDSHGLTAEEAARIQPTYGPPPGEVSAGGVKHGLVWASVGSMAANATVSVFNVARPSRASVVLGLVGGAATFGAGAYAAGHYEPSEGGDVAAAAAGVGAATAIIALWRSVNGVRPKQSARTVAGDATVLSTRRSARGSAGRVFLTPGLVAAPSGRASPGFLGRIEF